ncbi:MAG: hypothetical protein OEY86_11730 [Nitrospira sp.]|nr:hypothetical protein [Nitrospira sp.]
MKVEHPGLEPFEASLRHLLETAFNSGVKAIESKGYRFEDIQRDRTAMSVFIRGCHYGYDRAQTRVGAAVIALEKQIREKKEQLKEFRRLRNEGVSELLEMIKALEDRQLVMRRIIDTIVYSMLGEDEWIIRRLGSGDEIRSIDPQVLERTLRVASARNEQSRYTFAVVVDLSTSVQIGDLFEISFQPGEKRAWRILELKEGKVNALLSEILGEKASLTEEDRISLQQRLDKSKMKQVERMVRQRTTLSQLEEVIETDHGIDYGTKQEITLSPDVIVVDDYEEDLCTLIEKSAREGHASKTIDECLHVIAVKPMQKLRPRALVPLFHLLAHPGCLENQLSSEDLTKEWEAFAKNAPIIDLVDLSMRIPHGRPIFYWVLVSRLRQVDLAMGHIRLFAYFDIEAFLERVRLTGIKASWITGKEAHELKKVSRRIMGSPNAYGVRVEYANGNVQDLMSGFFSRVLVYQTKPSSLLKMMRNLDQQSEKIAMTRLRKKEKVN